MHHNILRKRVKSIKIYVKDCVYSSLETAKQK